MGNCLLYLIVTDIYQFPFRKEFRGPLKATYEIKSYKEAKNLQKNINCEYRPSKVIVSPTHLVSRLSYEYYSQKYSDLKILCFDAHDDRGCDNFPDNLWINTPIARNMILVGGNAESALKSNSNCTYTAVYNEMKTLFVLSRRPLPIGSNTFYSYFT